MSSPRGPKYGVSMHCPSGLAPPGVHCSEGKEDRTDENGRWQKDGTAAQGMPLPPREFPKSVSSLGVVAEGLSYAGS